MLVSEMIINYNEIIKKKGREVMSGYSVYSITHIPSGKAYIGQTSHALNNRFSWHFSNARNSKKKSVFVEAIRKFPRNEFRIELLKKVTSKAEAIEWETYFIIERDTINTGFNMRKSEHEPWNKGKKMTDEYCKNLRGSNNGMFGKTHSDEYKKWRSEYMKVNQLGTNNHSAKRVHCVELNRTWNTVIECAKELNLHKDGISHVCRGKHKTCGGYHFKYV